MRVLITGGAGLLGQYLNIELNKEHEILTIYNNNVGNCKDFNSAKVDITDYDSLKQIFEEFRPEVVIHLASISRPETADQLPLKVVNEVNVNAVQKIAEFCDKYSAKLFFTSTDLVYDGDRGAMLKEDSKLIPKSLYAETKLMGEVKIKNTFENYVILRTSLQYGIVLGNNKSGFNSMYENFKKNEKVRLFRDQFRTPSSLLDTARMFNELLKIDIKEETMNFGGKERVSRVELGEILCEEAGFDKSLIDNKSMDEVDGIYRVADVSMNTSKLQSYGIMQKGIRESIVEILNSYPLK